MQPAPELVADTRCQIAESPVWHPDQGCLYWTDVPAGRMYRFSPATGTCELVYQGDPIGGICVQDDGALLLLGARGSVKVWRDGGITGIVLAEIAAERETRFNDVIADPEGRVFSGTMATRDEHGQVTRYGNLYRLDTDGTHRVVLERMGSPNGMGFAPDLRHLYLTDSIAGVQAISRLGYDRATGRLGNGHLFHRTPLDGWQGRPDGMTVDAEGYVWSALWDGGAVVRLRADGTELERFPIPVPKVSSLTFGGPGYTDLYITTARGQGNEPGATGAGGIFRLRAVGIGRPEFRSRIGR